MRLNYKRLGDYIREVDVRNKGLKVSNLLGLTINKQFIPSVANTIGTDMENYKIIRKNQFACSTMQVRRDGKMPVALLQDIDEAIISQAYPVFEVTNKDKLLPDYLMMWFSRSEFDREACFHAVGGVRGSLEWEDFLNFVFPVPYIDKQREIVAEYNAVQKRIDLNNQLIKKLEETAQAVYKEWFVDFEFPDDNGKPYKSNGGEMEWCEELGKEMPKGWEMKAFKEIIEIFISKRGKSKSIMNLQPYSIGFNIPVISAMNISNRKIVKSDTIPYISEEEYNEWMGDKLQIDDVLLTSEAPLGETYYISINPKLAISQRLFGLRTIKDKISGWYLFHWLNTSLAKQELEGRASGTTVFGIRLSELKEVRLLVPYGLTEEYFLISTRAISKLIESKSVENQKLTELKSLLLSKMATIKD